MKNVNEAVNGGGTAVTDVVTPVEAKRKSASLAANGDILTIFALRRPSGGATVHVETRSVKTKKTERGCTRSFDTFEAAVAALEELVGDAVKKGWRRRERAGGFKARPDAFSAIAAPSKAKR